MIEPTPEQSSAAVPLLHFIGLVFESLRNHVEDEDPAASEITWESPVAWLVFDTPPALDEEQSERLFEDPISDADMAAAVGAATGVLLRDLTHRAAYEIVGDEIERRPPLGPDVPADPALLFRPWTFGGGADESWWATFLGGASGPFRPEYDAPLLRDADLRSPTLTATGALTSVVHPAIVVYPLVLDPEAERSYHPVAVGLVVEGAPLSEWPADERDRLWDGIWDELAAAFVPPRESEQLSPQLEKLRHVEALGLLERNIARSPIFAPDGADTPGQLVFGPVGMLYNKPFNALEPLGPLGDLELFFISAAGKRFLDDGLPEDCVTPMSMRQALRYADLPIGGGGEQILKNMLAKIRSATYQADWQEGPHKHGWRTFGIMDAAEADDFTPQDRGFPEGQVRLHWSKTYRELILAGNYVQLDRPTQAAFKAPQRKGGDKLAGRLWAFWQAERLDSTVRNYGVFSAPPGEPPRKTWAPALADLLRISHWQQRKRIVHRIRQALRAVERIDPRYQCTLRRTKEPGMWTVEVTRRAGLPPGVHLAEPPTEVPQSARAAEDAPSVHSAEPERAPCGTLPVHSAEPDSSESPANHDIPESPHALLHALLHAEESQDLTSQREDSNQTALADCPDDACRARARVVAMAVEVDYRAAKAAAAWADAACWELHGLTHRLHHADPARQGALCERVLVESMTAIVARKPENLGGYLRRCADMPIVSAAGADDISAEVRAACDALYRGGGDPGEILNSLIDDEGAP